jgi:hypothetical protein
MSESFTRGLSKEGENNFISRVLARDIGPVAKELLGKDAA